MEARLLSALGKIAGLAGIAIGVFFLLYSGLIQYLLRQKADLEPAQAYAAFHSLTILIFGISAIGIVGWLIARSAGPRTPVPASSMLAMSFLVIAVIGMAAYVGTIPPKAALVSVPQQRSPPQRQVQKINFVVCVGQYDQRCPPNSVHLSCGSSIEAWASSQCNSIQVTKRADMSGNKCGYYVADVSCERTQ